MCRGSEVQFLVGAKFIWHQPAHYACERSLSPSQRSSDTKQLYNICTLLDKRRRHWADVVKCYTMFCVCRLIGLHILVLKTVVYLDDFFSISYNANGRNISRPNLLEEYTMDVFIYKDHEYP